MDNNCRQLCPARIVSLSPSNTEILFAVGAGNKVVGVTDYCDHPAQLEAQIRAKKTFRVGGYWNPSVEKILALDPDLVLVSTAKCSNKTNDCKTECSRSCEITIKTAKELESLGINVLMLSPHSLDDVFDDILLVGNATGKSSRARKIAKDLRQRTNTVIEASKTIAVKPKVYFEVWKDPYISVNSQTWIGNLISLAGGENVFGDALTEWPLIGPDDVVKVNPDVMLFPVIPDVVPFWESFEAVQNRKGWKNVSAIKNERLSTVLRDCVSRPGPRLVESLEQLSKFFHEIS
ncbi:MAG: cobalamin-binding protein [Candidatus Bathyarchaeota archaeon]|nr:MAG: cobalamin-binding protein [Candidatus Bathyarchaeum tardum]WNZ29890.1 MAG: cobalamin-binding protein [Candidatus Bathyarchaeota archaeon]